MSKSVLLLCPDVITERMAGPAIRYWEFAQALCHQYQVTLASPNEVPPDIVPDSFRCAQHNLDSIAELVAQHDIIIFQGHVLNVYPLLRDTDKVLVADLYDPIPLEWLELHRHSHNGDSLQSEIRIINDQLKRADYFLCANERQRDLWLGHLLSLGRINTHTYADMAQRVVTVPFGLPDTPPQKVVGDTLRQHLDPDAGFILLWGGGIWEWFDPLVVIRALHQVLPDYPDTRLVFLGTKHPNPMIDAMPMQARAEALARELGLYGKEVVFLEGWVPYKTLANYLLEADVGVSAHFNTLETCYSFRTRILHYLWASKPVLTTQGDVLAVAIAQHHAGLVLDEADEKAWIQAIYTLRQTQQYQRFVQGTQQLAQIYLWSAVTQPLQQLCQNACHAQDMRFEQGQRISLIWDCEQTQRELLDYIDFIEQSHSWKLTAPLRAVRRWLRL